MSCQSHSTLTRSDGRGRLDVDLVRDAAAGQWKAILERVAGIPAALLDQRHHECPKCAGTDRFRLLDEDAGAVLCNQCFKSRNGDGFAAVMWMRGIAFPEAVREVAAFLGVDAGGGPARKKAAPDEQLVFLDWNDVLIALWLRHKPGVIPAGVKAAGGRLARYMGRHIVVAFPVWGSGLDSAEPVGWALCNTTGGPLPRFTLEGKIEAVHKPKLTYGSRPGLLGDLARLRGAVICWKCEGLSDLLAWLSMPDLPPDHAAVTNANGAQERPAKWMLTTIGAEGKRPVYVVHDADMPGQRGSLGWDEHGRHRPGWAEELAGAAKECRNVLLPYPVAETHGKDLRDWLVEGGDFAGLRALAEKAEPVEPAPDTDETAMVVFSNANTFWEENEAGERAKKTVPLTMEEIKSDLFKLTGDWPRRVGSTLFVHDAAHGICWLETPGALFGWLHSFGRISWKGGSDFVKQSELLAELSRTARQYVSVENFPHQPRITDHYYVCGEVPRGDGSALTRLIQRFAPATEFDMILLAFAFVTPGWGGPPGSRPCFVITSDDGRGTGKSTAAAMIAQLWGGALQFSQNEEVAEIKKRLLSPTALPRRIAVIDNIKSFRFSWGDLENLITTPEISGHRLYHGEATRPNTLTWILTLNGANLSTDMAQRSIIVKLRRPERSGTWEEETRAFIETHREQLLGDITTALRDEIYLLDRFSRWASWEKDILQRYDRCKELQTLILDRQAAVDVEEEESGILEDFIRDRLHELVYDPLTQQIFIPSAVTAEWFNAANNDRAKVPAVSRILKQLITEGRLPRLQVNVCRSWGRGFIWSGEESDPNDTIRTDIQPRLEKLRKGILA